MVLITLSAVNAVSAADSSVIYVNNSGGNDIWDGQYAEWIVDTLSGPKKSIKNATGTVSEGGTVQISNGVYTGTGNTNITISRNMTITGQNKDKTIISGNDTNWIFKVVSNVSVTIQNLTMTNGNATYGGAIYNNGTLTVFDSIFPNNKATALGGAIYNYNGTISSLKGCTFTNNSAGFGGAIDNNYCTIGTVIDCNFTGNNAIYGGAISNWEGNITTLSGSTFSNNAASKSGGAVSNYKGIITNWSNCNLTNNTAADEDYGGGAVFNYGTIANLSGCNFIGNNATDSGGAIYNNGTINVHFNIFLNNSATKGSAIYCSDGTVDAEYNWWGSNDNPSGKISGFAVSKWIVLTVNVSSTSISRGKTSTITADLLHDSDGVYHDPADGHVPDGVNVSFKSDSLGHVNSESVSTSNGIATTTFISENLGLATVSAAADSQTMNTQISAGRNDVYVSNTGSDTDGDGSQSNPFKTIKTGILNVFPGGRLHIADGTYTGENNTNVAISSDMTITGQIRDSTIINGTNSAQIFQIQNGVNVKIVNLTLTNGNSANGGAICNYGNLTVANCTFTGNTANSGGAIFNYGVLTIENNTFTNNTATETDFDNGGGAIFNEATVTVNGSDFTGNKANNGGAIYNKYTCIVKDSSFVNNTAVTYAGAIYNYFSTLNVTNTIFSDNNASSGGAVFNDGGYSTIKDCTFNSNVALNEGGAIDNFKDVMTDYQYLTLIDTTFTGNHADSGGAIVNSGYLNITNGTFKNNTVEFGGAIFNYASLNVVKRTFISNNATDGGAILNLGNLTVIDSYFSANNATSSGAISNSGTLNIKNTKFNGNTASNMGGAIENADDLTVSDSEFTDNKAISGGAIYNYADSGFSGNLNVKNCTFTGNQAIGTASEAFGGAIFNFGTLIIENSTFTGDSAINGGAIYNKGNLTVKNTNFIDNNATHGGAIYNYYGTIIVNNSNFTRNNAYNIPYAAQGGAIYNYYGTMTMNSCDFTSNYAYEFGGAVYNDYGTITMDNSNFAKNNAVEDGGAIHNYNGILNIDNSNFAKNNAVEDGGAIHNYNGILNIDNTMFTNNSVTGGYVDGGFCGGAIYNYGTLTVLNSIFTGNNATSSGGAIKNDRGNAIVINSTFTGNNATNGGGAISNGDNLTVTSSNFEDNHTPGNNVMYSGFGGAISNGGNLGVHFSRFVRNTASKKYTLFSGNNIYNSGSLDVDYNWWSSNDGPGDSVCTKYPVYDIYTPSNWLILYITNFPNLINDITTSTITVDLTHDNVGNYYDPALGHVLDGIPVSFTTTLGSIDNQAFTVDGIAQTTLNGGLISGVADVTTIMDYQALDTFVSIDTIPPTVTTMDPANNTKTNSTNKVITVTFSEAIQVGSAYDSISVIGPSGAVPITKNIKGNILTITLTSSYINGNYTLNIPVNAVTDLAGNGLEMAFTSGFTVDTVPPTVTTSPIKGVSNSSITVNLLSESDAAIYYRINSGTWHTFTGSGNVLISNIGTNKLEFYAVDTAGNPSNHTIYSYTIDKKAPVVTATPTSGLSKSISVTLSSESNAKIYYRINGGSWHNFTGTGKLSITSSGTNKLEFYAVDAAGNPSVHKIYTYTIDKTAPKVISTYPKRYAAGVSRTARIYLKFSEKIKTSINWSKIVVKDKYGHTVKISKSISGNILYIKTGKRSSYSYYTVYIPKSAVKDYAGNNLAAGYIFKFKTGRY